MGRSWLTQPTFSPEYQSGIKYFIEFAKKNFPNTEKINCPCSKCSCCRLRTFSEVEEHLYCNRFLKGYSLWYYHGEVLPNSLEGLHDLSLPQESDPEMNTTGYNIGKENNDIHTLIEDVFGFCGSPLDNEDVEDEELNNANSLPKKNVDDKEARKIKKLVNDANEELYKGCKNFSRLSFILRLFHIKCMNGWSAKSFSMVMELLNGAFPDCSLPDNSYATKQYMKSFGLGYEKIHVCPKDCILYKGNFSAQECCHVCGSSRYKSESDNVQAEELEGKKKRKKKPAKILRYFLLIPRLQRLFMSSKTAADMRWHREGRKDDGLLRHPADTKLWKSFDEQFPEFSCDPRNVRLGLASDGFNPFKRSVHTTWPVILIPYNMAPWHGMKQPSFIMSMIIPGPKSPGNDIDVFMQLMFEELQTLWIGVDTYDASSGETFKMKAAVIGTINDFPAYSMLSGQTTKGRFACPKCEEFTDSRWLVNGRKFCYMGHRKWLESNHNFRNQKSRFDGTSEHRVAPAPLTGQEVLKKVSSLSFTYGKGSKNKKSGRKRKRDGDAGENECENPDRIKI